MGKNRQMQEWSEKGRSSMTSSSFATVFTIQAFFFFFSIGDEIIC